MEQLLKERDELIAQLEAEKKTFAKKCMHDALVEAYGETPLVYLIDIGELPDGRMLYKFGETDRFIGRLKYLCHEYGKVYLVKVYPCAQAHKYEQWLKRQPFFIKNKYVGAICGGRSHEEVLAIKPEEFKTLTTFIKKHQGNYDGWSPEQQLEKLRLQLEIKKYGNEKQIVEDEPEAANAGGSSQVEHFPTKQPKDIHTIAEVGPNLFPVKPTKLGRPAALRQKLVITDDTPNILPRFLSECFVQDPESFALVAHVKMRYYMFRAKATDRSTTKEMTEFFESQFQVVQKMVDTVKVKCSMYKGIEMKPWTVDTDTLIEHQEEDVAAFFREMCEVNIMGRARTKTFMEEFAKWKQQEDPTYKCTIPEKNRVNKHLRTLFISSTNVAIDSSSTGNTGFYGFYMKSATEEERTVGYFKSPNTRREVVQIDANYNIVKTFESQDAVATVIKKSAQYFCQMLSKAYREDHGPYLPGDSYGYMRMVDYEIMMEAKRSV